MLNKMKMNLIAKILIVVDVVFCLGSFFLMGYGKLNVTASDIAVVGSVIMSPELFVAINKIFEKTTKESDVNK